MLLVAVLLLLPLLLFTRAKQTAAVLRQLGIVSGALAHWA
jgi:hypothetical protein